MTREEAIYRLAVIKGSKQFIQGFGTKYNKDIEAIDMAISALSVLDQIKWERDEALATLEEHGIGLGQKAEYIIPNGDVMFTSEVAVQTDLISRADAIEAVGEWGTNEERKGNLTMTMVSVKQCVADILSALPSADAVQGEWIPKQMQHKVTREVYEMAECSVCGAAYVRYENDDYSFDLNKPNYCPNCGARMEASK